MHPCRSACLSWMTLFVFLWSLVRKNDRSDRMCPSLSLSLVLHCLCLSVNFLSSLPSFFFLLCSFSLPMHELFPCHSIVCPFCLVQFISRIEKKMGSFIFGVIFPFLFLFLRALKCIRPFVFLREMGRMR